MPATVIAERIGWDRGMRILKDRVRELKEEQVAGIHWARAAQAAGARGTSRPQTAVGALVRP